MNIFFKKAYINIYEKQDKGLQQITYLFFKIAVGIQITGHTGTGQNIAFTNQLLNLKSFSMKDAKIWLAILSVSFLVSGEYKLQSCTRYRHITNADAF